MATTLISAQIPEPFRWLLSPVKVVQDAIEERTENKVSLLEGQASVTLHPDNPSVSNGVDIISSATPTTISFGSLLQAPVSVG